jgi:hypothetical protein
MKSLLMIVLWLPAALAMLAYAALNQDHVQDLEHQ